MAILARVSFEDGAQYEEVFRWRKSPAVWGRDDLERFARQMHALIGGPGAWRWSLETSSPEPHLVVRSAKGTATSGPLRLSKQVIEMVAGEEPRPDGYESH